MDFPPFHTLPKSGEGFEAADFLRPKIGTLLSAMPLQTR